MSNNPKAAFRIDYDELSLPDDAFLARVVPFDGVEDAMGLAFPYELSLPEPVIFEVTDLQTVAGLDYVSNVSDWPLMSTRMIDALSSVRGFAHRRIPIVMREGKADDTLADAFVGVQLLDEREERLDRQHARFVVDDEAPEFVSHVSLWRIEEPTEGLPPLFRLGDGPTGLFVSAEGKSALDALGVRGCALRDLDEISRADERRASPGPRSDLRTPSPSRVPIVELPLDKEWELDFGYEVAHGCVLVQDMNSFGDPSEPEDAIRRIRAEIDRYFDTDQLPDNMTLNEYQIALAALWAACLVEATDWTLALVVIEGTEMIAVAPPDRSLVVLPFFFIPELLAEKGDNNVALLFNMIVAGRVPRAEPGALWILS